VQPIAIDQFLSLLKEHPVIDVRSPGEYSHAHIPGAHNIALFSDEERKAVGAAYKQQSREAAIKIGLDYYGPKMRQIVEQAEEIVKQCSAPASKTILLHCWRGGMRSQAIAWLLHLYGFKVYLLQGGYKAYRNWVLSQFAIDYPLHVVGGYSGSGKTYVLHELSKKGHAVIDLEGIALHKGSAFGGLGREGQPSQEMFENILAETLYSTAQNFPGAPVWIEDESRRIGIVNLPEAFWDKMRASPLYFLDIPFEKRLAFIVQEYGIYKKQDLENSILRIQKRLGGLDTKSAINYLLEGNYTECFRILLRYYDKYYAKGLNDRNIAGQKPGQITCSTVDAATNAQQLITKLHTHG
jgi:tRNA 2-selenouridine synthase